MKGDGAPTMNDVMAWLDPSHWGFGWLDPRTACVIVGILLLFAGSRLYRLMLVGRALWAAYCSRTTTRLRGRISSRWASSLALACWVLSSST